MTVVSEYRLNDPRQGVIGPVRLATVRDLVDAGVIQNDVRVSKDGGPWLVLADFPELAGKVAAPGEPKPSFAGDLSKHSFFKVFYRFHLAKVTGRLRLQQDEPQRVDVYLESGEPVHVAASDGPTTHGATAERQVQLLIDLCSWRGGRYAFFDGERHGGERAELRVDSRTLIVRAARVMDEAVLAARLQPCIEQRVVSHYSGELDRGAVALSAFEAAVLRAIDGRRNLREVVLAVATDKESRRGAFATVFFLSEIDCVRFERG